MNASVCLSQSKMWEPGKGFNPSKLTEANRLRELRPVAGRVTGDKYQIHGNVCSRATAMSGFTCGMAVRLDGTYAVFI